MSDAWSVAAVFVMTYLLHSTILLGGCWLVTRSGRVRLSLQEVLWKAALTGSIATALLTSTGVMQPLWQVSVPVRAAATIEPVADEAPGLPEASVFEAGSVGAEESVLRQSATVGAAAAQAGVSPASGPAGILPPMALTWRGGLATAWLVLSAGLFGTWLLRRRRLYALLGVREPVRDAVLQARFAELCDRAAVRKARLTASAACPLPLALTGAEVCVPARFATALDAEQQDGALAHEVAHLARRDPAWLFGTHLIGAVFFFQPLNLLARRHLREIAESMCDDWAAQQGRGVGLARCLAEVASWLQPRLSPMLSAASPMASSRAGLLERVKRLLRDEARRERTPGRGARAAIAGAVVVAAAMTPSLNAAPSASVIEASLGGAPARVQLPRFLRAQQPVYRAPDGQAPLAQRLAWAEEQARSRGSRGYWVAYAVRRAIEPGQWYLSDSDGISINGFGRTDNPIGQQLGHDPSFSDGTVIVLLRHDGGRQIVRIGHRSVAAPMEFDGRPIFWLGTAPDGESLDYLTGLMRGPVQGVKLQAELVDAVALHSSTALVLPILRDILGRHASPEIRAEAVEGVEHHPVAESLALALEVARTDASTMVRGEAAEAIGSLPVPGAVEALVELALRGTAGEVRREAAEALGELKLRDAVGGIERVVFGASDAQAVAEAVEALGERDEDVLPLLRRIIWEHPDANASIEAVETLADLKGRDVLPLLVEILERHPVAEVQHEALDVLGDMGTPQAWRALIEAAHAAPMAGTRREAVQALADYASGRGETAEREAAVVLERVIFNDADRGVQLEALDALTELRGAIGRPVLRKVAETHPDRTIRREARDELEG